METVKTAGLERPLVVQLAAAVLIATPLMDILTGQRTGSYLFDMISWVLIFGAGVSLMVRHKSSWMLGIVLCLSFVVYTGYTIVLAIGPGGNPVTQTAKLLDCLLVAFIVGSVFYFFRYPYLDRRQHWFAPTGSRFAAQIPVVINGTIQSQTVDLSYTGARIAVPQGSAFKKGDRVSLALTEINDILCHGQILDVQESFIRVHFEDTSSAEQELIRQWLSSQNLPKA